MSPPTIRNAAPQLIFGVFVILLGLLFLLDNLEIVGAGRFIRFWFPALLIAAGVVKLLQTKDGGGVIIGGLLMFVGALFVFEDLGYFRFSVWDLWPVVLVGIGLSMIWRTVTNQAAVVAPTPRGGASERVSGVAIFGAFKKAVGSHSFAGGTLTAVFGGCDLDLRDASISDGEATLEVFSFCGGVELKVPEDWSVDMQVFAVLGGSEDKTRQPNAPTGKRLIVRGTVMLGAVEIRN